MLEKLTSSELYSRLPWPLQIVVYDTSAYRKKYTKYLNFYGISLKTFQNEHRNT